MVLQSCKAPYPALIIISESRGTPSAHPPPFNESCIPSSHVASCTVLNWATVTKNGEVAQRLFVHENRCLSALEDRRIKAHWGNGITVDCAVARERPFDLMLGKSFQTAWELGQRAFENNSFELLLNLFNSNNCRKSNRSRSSDSKHQQLKQQ